MTPLKQRVEDHTEMTLNDLTSEHVTDVPENSSHSLTEIEWWLSQQWWL